MAALYAGVEEVAFKKVDSGYVFKTNNPWFIGPRRFYSVNEAQKTEIAACLRETLRRLKPLVFTMMIVFPLAILGGVFWLLTSSGTLTIIEVDAARHSAITTQFIDPFVGSTGTLRGSDGSSIVFHINTPPGKGATISYTNHMADGKLGMPTVVDFTSGDTELKLTDSKGNILKLVALTGKSGGAPVPVMLYSMLLLVGLFVPYLGFMHVYSMRRLRPLIADLPRSEERISFQDGMESVATKISVKLLVIMAGSCGLGFTMNAILLLNATLSHHSKAPSASLLIATITSALTTAYCAYIVFLRLKMKRRAY